jgi:hypothetical protein
MSLIVYYNYACPISTLIYEHVEWRPLTGQSLSGDDCWTLLIRPLDLGLVSRTINLARPPYSFSQHGAPYV